MGRSLVVAFVVAAGLLSPRATCGERPDPGVSVQPEFKGKLDPIGPFNWSDLKGRRWTEADFRGKVLIVQQWAAWCAPCIAEFPEVQKLFEAVRGNPSIAFISVNVDSDPASISGFLHQFQEEYSFPVLFARSQFKIKALPYTWIVDRDGYIREAFPSAGSELINQALALAEAVKHRPPVASLPIEVRQEARRQNEREALNSQ